MFRYLSSISLILWVSCSYSAIENRDFWFHEDGATVFIYAKRGAPLHIDYIGTALTKPLTIRVTPSNSQLKVSPSKCTFTPKNHDCRLILQNIRPATKVYGLNHFTITEVGSKKGEIKAQASLDAGSVGFLVGVKGQNMPSPLIVNLGGGLLMRTSTIGKAVIKNSTSKTRSYQVNIAALAPVESCGGDCYSYSIPSKEIELPPQEFCYADVGLIPDNSAPGFYTYSYPMMRYLSWVWYTADITNPQDPIYNGSYSTGERNISTCSAKGDKTCASNKWASWSVGLANLGAIDMEGGVRAGQVEALRDNSWNNGSYIYYDSSWNGNSLALLHIQGSIDGSGFDASRAAPSILEIESAPPCSSYAKLDTSVIIDVSVKAIGPGSIVVPRALCSYRKSDNKAINCSAGDYKNSWVELTAVPDVGKAFKGWVGVNGECDKAGVICRIQLTSDIKLSAIFE